MGIFDVFDAGPGQSAALQARNAQRKGLKSGFADAQGYLTRGNTQSMGYLDTAASDLERGAGEAYGYLDAGVSPAAGYYTDALRPFEQIYGQEQQGRQAYMNALGLGGAAGNEAARNMFQAGPGYEWQLGQGLDAINRRRAAGGMLRSGNADIDALTYGQGLANQEFGNWRNELGGFNPMAAASQRAGILGNLASLYANAGSAKAGIASGLGADRAALGQTRATSSTDMARRLADLAYGTRTGIGQTNAQYAQDKFKAEEAANNALWSTLFGLGNLGVSAYGAGTPKNVTNIWGGDI